MLPQNAPTLTFLLGTLFINESGDIPALANAIRVRYVGIRNHRDTNEALIACFKDAVMDIGKNIADDSIFIAVLVWNHFSIDFDEKGTP